MTEQPSNTPQLSDPENTTFWRHQALEWALAFHAGKTQNFTIVLETAKAFEAYLDGVE